VIPNLAASGIDTDVVALDAVASIGLDPETMS